VHKKRGNRMTKQKRSPGRPKIANPKKVYVSFRIDQDTYNNLEKLAASNQGTVNQFARSFMQELSEGVSNVGAASMKCKSD
jgi:uncharacterized protein (DUF4415 family)